MKIKGIIAEDFVNYKKPSMTIMFPYCSFKCDKECGKQVCQNCTLATTDDMEISIKSIVKSYMTNDITQAIVMLGLEPLDSWEELWQLIVALREQTLDDIVIYTGYTEEEFYNMRYIPSNLRQFPNIIVKFGRYIPDCEGRYDEILGVTLASKNQYAQIIS